MKKILIIHSVPHPLEDGESMAKVYKETLEFGIKRIGIENFKITTSAENFRKDFPEKVIPRGYDFYLVHPRDVHHMDLIDLRRQQPQTWIYCCNRTREIVVEEERGLYDEFLGAVSDEEIDEMLNKIKNPRSER